MAGDQAASRATFSVVSSSSLKCGDAALCKRGAQKGYRIGKIAWSHGKANIEKPLLFTGVEVNWPIYIISSCCILRQSRRIGENFFCGFQ